jgi:hypothetical protein
MILAVWRAYSTTEFWLEPANSLTRLCTAHNRQLATATSPISLRTCTMYVCMSSSCRWKPPEWGDSAAKLLPQEREWEPLLWVVWCTTGLRIWATQHTPHSNCELVPKAEQHGRRPTHAHTLYCALTQCCKILGVSAHGGLGELETCDQHMDRLQLQKPAQLLDPHSIHYAQTHVLAAAVCLPPALPSALQRCRPTWSLLCARSFRRRQVTKW